MNGTFSTIWGCPIEERRASFATLDEMGIDIGIDVDRVLNAGRMVERIVGRRLRSETIKSGRVPKKATGF